MATKDTPEPDEGTIPGLRLVGPGADVAAPADAGPPATPLDEARQMLADADPLAYHRMLTGLVRPSHHSVLQTLPYSSALEFHDPSCVVVEPRPTGLDTMELYSKAAFPEFESLLMSVFADPARNRSSTRCTSWCSTRAPTSPS